MGQDEIMRSTPGSLSMEQATAQMLQIMQGMAVMLQATNDRMAALEQQVRLLTKVTPAQARELNAAMRTRAEQLCAGDRRLAGSEKALTNAIRRDVRLATGVQSMRELARCDYAVTLRRIQMWDDPDVVRSMRKK